MHRIAVTFLALATILPTLARADDKDKFKLEEGFKLIFNGKNLDGWKEATAKNKDALDGKTEAFKGRFKVTDGTLVIDPSVKGDLHIETKQEFGKDVHIKFDFKAGPKCNNDLFLRNVKFDINPTGKEAKEAKEGEWATFEIVVKGETMEHKINGKTARTTKLGDKNKGATPFRIRAEFGAIEIKNVRVKE